MSPRDAQQADASEAGIAAAFFCALYEDRAAGRVLPLEHYQARFRGFEALIARELAAFEAEEEAEAAAEGDAGALPAPSSARGSAAGSERASDSSAEGPRNLGRYRLLRSLGRGGQGEVWLAEDPRLERRVALKILHTWSAASPQAFARFRREAMIASRLDHPGICTVYESGIEQGLPYFAMRFVEGESLAQRIAAQRARWLDQRARDASTTPTSKAELPTLLATLESAARAVHAAHEAGVVHRDLKPANIVVTASGQPVLLDFGLARDLESDASSLTHTGEIFGTPDYMAPEQVNGKIADIDARTDVYALGATLFECLTLRRPFSGATRDALYHAILHAAPPNLRKLVPHAPRDLEVIVQTALEKDPARRYRSALELAEDLSRLQRGEPIRARRVGPLRRAWRWAQREPLSASLLVAALLATAIGGYGLARWLETRGELAAAKRLEAAVQLEEKLEEGFLDLGEEELGRAVMHFSAVLDLAPEHPEAVIGLVLAQAWGGQILAARETLERHRRLFAEAPELVWVETELLYQEGRNAEGRALEERADQVSTALALFLRGFQEIRRGHTGDAAAFSRAESRLQRCMLATPVARRLYHFQYAHAVGHGSDLELRKRTAEALVEIWPEAGMTWYWAGFLLSKVDAGASARAYEEATRKRPNDERAHTNFGNQWRALGDLDRAEAAHRRALELQPTYAHAWYNLGNLLRARKDELGAEQAYRQALSHAPGFAGANANLHRILRARGDLDGALSHLREELRYHPENQNAWADLGQILRQAKRYEEAEEVFRNAFELHPRSATCWAYYGFLKQARGDDAAAIDAFERAVSFDPRDVMALRQLGKALLETPRRAEAHAPLSRACELEPEGADNWFYLSRAEWRRGRIEEAIRCIRQALLLEPQQLEHSISLAHLLREADRDEPAAAVCQEILARAPEQRLWRTMGGLALCELGRFAEGAPMVAQGIAEARAAKDRTREWDLWERQARELEIEAAAALERAQRGEPLPSEPQALLRVAELASARGEPALALRAFGELCAREQPALGLLVRAARAAELAQDPRASTWLAQGIEQLLDAAGNATPFDLACMAEAWLGEPWLVARLAEPGASDLRGRLSALARPETR
ncbi:MAG: protein kinase [Planctomycetes bacterium]|nr:protein kinase [Planctomycetota bacterium]